ncbi:MAG: glycosyltransferase family 2 protein [Bacteroidota bacterium]
MEQSPSLVCIVLNYMIPTDTIECLQSLHSSSYQNMRIVVVDNASPDSSVETIRKEYPNIEIARTEKNNGWAGGINYGIKYALLLQSKYILIINGDTLVDKDYIRLLIESLEGHQIAGAAAGTIFYYPDVQKIWFAGGFISYIRSSGFSRHELPEQVDNVNNSEKVTFVSGCSILFRSDALKKVGLFDERYFLYLEDTDMCVRLLDNGYHLLYVRGAKLFHKVVNERDAPHKLYYSVRNRLFFAHLHMKGWRKIIAFGYLYCVFTLKLVIWRITQPDMFVAAWNGIMDYMNGVQYKGRGYSLSPQKSSSI